MAEMFIMETSFTTLEAVKFKQEMDWCQTDVWGVVVGLFQEGESAATFITGD